MTRNDANIRSSVLVGCATAIICTGIAAWAGAFSMAVPVIYEAVDSELKPGKVPFLPVAPTAISLTPAEH